jgi:surfactin synthase thioesterase subunit/glycosyltransferase involved in cell wall biosynthesis
MRILLAQNSLYYPAHGGGDKSNRLLMEALAARGHECRAVARISVFGEREQERYAADLAARGVAAAVRDGVVSFDRNGVSVRVVTDASLRACFVAELESFRPEVILASTDDPAQLLLEAALRHKDARVVYLARATLAVPFGPDCAFPSAAKTDRLRAVDRVVGVSQYVADYFRRYAGIDAVHVPISLVEPEEWPDLGRFENEFVTLVNPCAVKGIDIFLALADAFPAVAFAAVPTWGTNERDRAALAARPNVRLLDPVDDINLLLARTRVLLVPSLWAEARSRIVVEAMLRGVPVMAADVGGIPEAKMGVPYLLPVHRIERYVPDVDEQMVPVAEVPAQEIGPWREALARLLTDRAHYEEIARESRRAALEYAGKLTVEAFEELLVGPSAPLRSRFGVEPTHRTATVSARTGELSAEKRRLLALRLRQRAPGSAWFPGIDASAAPRLFWFPHAGGAASSVQAIRNGQVGLRYIGVRLPGRESRLAEAPFERMAPLVEALAKAIEPYTAEPFAFFGHSMGAVVAFELARALRRRGLPLPRILIASAARAPQFRRNHVPPPAATDEELLASLNIPEELAPAVLPALRADTTLYRHYVYAEDAPLDCPIRAYGGTEDPNIAPHHLEGWREQTTGSFAVRLFPGGHFYLRESADAFRLALGEDLA